MYVLVGGTLVCDCEGVKHGNFGFYRLSVPIGRPKC